ncbi:hypothetical protein KDK88_03140 [bacterium]|nr:hypothetical protein [bacterium]HPF36586.1 hypothetical protein [Candidatus Krumholzibacteria bacterium]HRX51951.1 hypothetical protein [Candidatus Krumholzibacteria bacterium]
MRTLIVVLMLMSAALAAAAEPVGYAVGPTACGLVVTGKEGVDAETLTGAGLSVAYAIAEEVSLRAVGSRLTHQDLDDITVTGIDGHLQLGSHFLDDGWRRWVSFGFFTDIWTSPAASFTVQGLSAGLGAGYAWSKVQIDVQASVRSPESTHSRLQELGMAAERTPFLGQVTLSWRI